MKLLTTNLTKEQETFLEYLQEGISILKFDWLKVTIENEEDQDPTIDVGGIKVSDVISTIHTLYGERPSYEVKEYYIYWLKEYPATRLNPPAWVEKEISTTVLAGNAAQIVLVNVVVRLLDMGFDNYNADKIEDL